jgi:alkanesulfonate monooxygenase SsuD/methylene tetrahydromethanopterin reductase-like flavin-dependent oxidoreductase (luciferase family)
VQQPHPPLWYGVSKPSSCEWAAANDANVVMNGPVGPIRTITDAYRAEWARLGKPAGELPLIGCSRHIVIADSDRAAVEIAAGAYTQWWQSLQLLWQERGMTPPFISYPPTAEEAIRGGYVFAGSPRSVHELIGELVPQTGITYLLCRFAFGQMPAAAALRSVELFVREVMPAFAAD